MTKNTNKGRVSMHQIMPENKQVPVKTAVPACYKGTTVFYLLLCLPALLFSSPAPSLQAMPRPVSINETTDNSERHSLKFLNMPSSPVTSEHSPARCTNLLKHIVPSPDQQNGGSCLYMALTGIAEMSLSMKKATACNTPGTRLEYTGNLPKQDLSQYTIQTTNNIVSPHSTGNASLRMTDLSERYTMYLGVKYLKNIHNWKTDMVEVFNINKGACLNKSIPYTKGWYFSDNTDGTGPNGRPLAATVNAPNALYGTYFNWIAPLSSPMATVSLPEFRQTVLYEPPDGSPFSTGLHNRSIIKKVKDWLYNRNRPLLVIYNHFGYWHGVVIAGYDDNRVSSDWFVTKFTSYMNKKAAFFQQYGETQKAAKFRKWAADVTKNRQLDGGLSTGRGVFFVRDSLYADVSAPLYDYDTSVSGEESPLCLRYVEHDYTWLMHLANHITGIDFSLEN